MTLPAAAIMRPRNAGGLPRQRLRLWLRLLRASRGMEAELRERLRVTYDLTLPQFDVLAAVARRHEGLTMTGLSRYLMVSNGNVTGIVDRLVNDGWLMRVEIPGDRRARRVRLTPRGHADFTAMAAVHARWVDELLDGFGKADTADLILKLDRLVGKLRDRDQESQPSRKRGARK
jgi:DNA-binding MarR family transcriptional regulator